MDANYTSRSLLGHASLAEDIAIDATGMLDRLRAGRIPHEGELLGVKAVAGNMAYALRALAEQHCPGHVASADDSKVCGNCGAHVEPRECQTCGDTSLTCPH